MSNMLHSLCSSLFSPDDMVNKVIESFNVINAREKPLAAHLFTNDKMLKEEFVESVSAGGLSINGTTLQGATVT